MFQLNMKNPKSKRGCVRQADIILNEAYRRFKGGLQYGLDLATFQICQPELYQR